MKKSKLYWQFIGNGYNQRIKLFLDDQTFYSGYVDKLVYSKGNDLVIKMMNIEEIIDYDFVVRKLPTGNLIIFTQNRITNTQNSYIIGEQDLKKLWQDLRYPKNEIAEVPILSSFELLDVWLRSSGLFYRGEYTIKKYGSFLVDKIVAEDSSQFIKIEELIINLLNGKQTILLKPEDIASKMNKVYIEEDSSSTIEWEATSLDKKKVKIANNYWETK